MGPGRGWISHHESPAPRALATAVIGLTLCATSTCAAAPALPDSVLAVVGSRIVTRSEFERERAATGTLSAAELLDQIVDRAVLLEAALAAAPAWTPADSVSFRALRDHLLLGAALDEALEEARQAAKARGDTALDATAIGIAAREAAVARAQPTADEELLERLAGVWSHLPPPHPDSSIAAQLRTLSTMPRVAPEDTGRVVLRSLAGDVRVSDLLAAWRGLAAALRPRIETAPQVRDLANNALFERALRAAAEARGLDRSPAIVAALEEARERNTLSSYIDREVFDGLEPDSGMLRRRYESDPARWAAPRRVRALRFDFDGREQASAMAARLLEPGAAESLQARARRSGVSYEVEISAGDDPNFVAAAERAGTGGLLGPEPGGDGWWVAHVVALVPARPRSFDEARRDLEQRWLVEEAKQRTSSLCERLRKRSGVRLNGAVLRRLRP